MSEEYYTLGELADLFKVHHETIRRWRREKRFKAIQTTPRGRVRVHHCEVQRLLASMASADQKTATGGPWWFELNNLPDWNGGVFYGTDANEKKVVIARVSDVTVQDAAMMVAAPVLLEALDQCLMHIEDMEASHGRPFAAGNVARNAIAAAKGKAVQP